MVGDRACKKVREKTKNKAKEKDERKSTIRFKSSPFQMRDSETEGRRSLFEAADPLGSEAEDQ